jgi:ubiquinone biosynthesis protein
MNRNQRDNCHLGESARLLRQQLQRLGPTYVKIGQYLALRSDLLPQIFCDELMLLADRAPPLPWSDVSAIMLQDFGKNPERLFSTISTSPVSSGSFSQTHVALLENGFEVLVKVKRPKAAEEVQRELADKWLINRLFKLANLPLPEFPEDLTEELSQWLFSQLDFGRELNNLSRMHELSLGSPFERIPVGHPAFSSEQVLTAEYIRGAPVSEVLIDLQSTGPDSATERLSGINPNRVAEAMVAATFRQVFRYRFLNTDFHQNNLVITSDNSIGFVSFACCEDLTPGVCARQMRYLAAIYRGDPQGIIHALKDVVILGASTQMSAFEADFVKEVAEGGAAADRGEAGTRRSTTGRAMIRTMQLARRHRLKIAPQVSSIHCAMSAGEGITSRLAPGANVEAVARQWLMALQLEDGLRTLLPENIRPTLPGLLGLLGIVPKELEGALAELQEGRLTVNTSISETPDVSRRSNQQTSLIGFAILSVGLAFLIGSSRLSELFGSTFSDAATIALVCLYIWITIGLIRLKLSKR